MQWVPCRSKFFIIWFVTRVRWWVNIGGKIYEKETRNEWRRLMLEKSMRSVLWTSELSINIGMRAHVTLLLWVSVCLSLSLSRCVFVNSWTIISKKFDVIDRLLKNIHIKLSLFAITAHGNDAVFPSLFKRAKKNIVISCLSSHPLALACYSHDI